MNKTTSDRTNASRLRQVLLLFFATALLAIIAPLAVVRGQQKSAANMTGSSASSSAPTPSATAPPPVAAPTPFPLAEVVTQTEATSANLRDIETDLTADQITATVNDELPLLTREIDARLDENNKILNSRPSLETLRNLEEGWKNLGEKLPGWKRGLTSRAAELDRELTHLTQLEQSWSLTLEQAQGAETPDAQPQTGEVSSSSATPPEILQRMQTVIAAIKQTRAKVERRRTQILTLQNRVAEQEARINEAITAIKQVREQTVNQLFVKDSPPIWSAEVRARAEQNLVNDSRASFTTQLSALGAYATRQSGRFVLHGAIFLLLVAGLYWARRQVEPWVAAEPSLAGVARVFHIPVATALVLSILLSGWIYPQAPRLLSAILGAAALIPTVIILRQLIERHLFPVLNALIVFYFVDQLRAVAVSLPALSRLLFLGEMLGGMIFLGWLIIPARLAKVPEAERNWLWKTIRVGARIAVVVFLAALVANALGYVSIASLVGNALLSSAYLAIILYAAVRIADGLIMFATRVRPLSLLGVINRHRPLLRRRIRGILRWIATLLWALYTLEQVSLRAPLVERGREILTAKLNVGALSISLSDVIIFIVTVYAAFLLSRFIRFILKEDVYPRLSLARGVPYAISTLLNYVILLVGFFFAVAAMGFDMTKFTILAGAFGVGLGFGLQNIVNNFVSGLILLFERPVKVGDVIQVDDSGGVVQSIGIRASVVRTINSSEIIMPNSKLISERVTNWTYSNRQRGIEIVVGVEYGTAPRRVIELLLAIAKANPHVTDAPPPQALFTEFGADSINFTLRAWTNDFEKWIQMRSDLAVAIYERFNAEGISIPNMQRDLHLRSIDPEAVKALAGLNSAKDDGHLNHNGQEVNDVRQTINRASGAEG